MTFLSAIGATTAGAATGPAGISALRSGEAGSYSWAVRAGTGQRGAACLEVAIAHRRGRFAYDRSRFRDCATELTAKGPPLIVGGTEQSGARAGMTVLAIAVAPGVDRLRLAFSDGGRETISAQPLAVTRPAAAPPRRAGPSTPRYALVAIPQRRCLARVVTQDAAGRALWTSDDEGCLPELVAAG